MKKKARLAFGRYSGLHRTIEAALCAAVVILAAAACNGEDGAAAKCPDLPLYDVKSDAAPDPAVVEARETAAAAGCLTLEGDATTPSDDGELDASDQ